MTILKIMRKIVKLLKVFYGHLNIILNVTIGNGFIDLIMDQQW